MWESGQQWLSNESTQNETKTQNVVTQYKLLKSPGCSQICILCKFNIYIINIFSSNGFSSVLCSVKAC